MSGGPGKADDVGSRREHSDSRSAGLPGAFTPSQVCRSGGLIAPETAFAEAREWLPGILERRHLPVAPALATLDLIAGLVQKIEFDAYSQREDVARQRMDQRVRTIGPSWRQLWCSIARSGRRTPTSSGAEWQRGLRTEWSCISRRLAPAGSFDDASAL